MTTEEFNKDINNKDLIYQYLYCKKCKHYKKEKTLLTDYDIFKLNLDLKNIPDGISVKFYKDSDSCEIYENKHSATIIEKIGNGYVLICPKFDLNKEEKNKLREKISELNKEISDYSKLIDICKNFR